MTLNATAGVVMIATGVAVALVIYAALTGVHLLPTALGAQGLVRLAY